MHNNQKTSPNKLERLYFLDWVRVIAFLLLIIVHSAIPFVPFGLPLIQNDETSQALSLLLYFLHGFRLEVLFLVSGVGTYFATRKLSSQYLISERFKRLIIPTVIACFTLMPVMVYYEKLHVGAFTGDFVSFYPAFFTNGSYPHGNFSWGQMWFVVYLFTFVLLALPFFKLLKGEVGESYLALIKNTINKPHCIYLFVLPFLFLEITLRPYFPGARDLISDWASFSQWFLYFLIGYTFIAIPQIFNLLEQIRVRNLILALSFSCLTMYFKTLPELGFVGQQLTSSVLNQVLLSFIKVSNTWCWVLTLLGFAKYYLQRNSSILQYCNEAIYPIFILHFTVSVMLSYWLVECINTLSMWTKFGLVTLWTFVIIMTIYHFLIRPFNIMRLFFGLKPLNQ